MTPLVWAAVVIAALNALLVLATVVVKASRRFRARRREARRAELEPLLFRALDTGDPPRRLRRATPADHDVLATVLLELVTVLRGHQHERLLRLAGQLGLVERDLRRLGSRRLWDRAVAAEHLGHYGGPGVTDRLVPALQDPEETVRSVAARALSRIGTAEAAHALTENLVSPSRLTGLRMAENLERLGTVAVPPLIRIIESEVPAERHGQVLAARVVGHLGLAQARPALRLAVHRRWNSDLRAQATAALGRIGHPDDVATLALAADDASWPVRVQAAHALGRVGDASTIPVLERLSTDLEWPVRTSATQALAGMGPAGERALRSLLRSPDRFARDLAAAALAESRRTTPEAAGPAAPAAVTVSPAPGSRS